MSGETRNILEQFLEGGQAYDTFATIVEAIPVEKRGVVPEGIGRSAWEILEHMRITQADLFEYIENENGSYRTKDWPREYWPDSPQPPTEGSWDATVKVFLLDRNRLIQHIRAGDLLRPFPWEPQHTLLRQVLIAGEHQAYHLGQMELISRLL